MSDVTYPINTAKKMVQIPRSKSKSMVISKISPKIKTNPETLSKISTKPLPKTSLKVPLKVQPEVLLKVQTEVLQNKLQGEAGSLCPKFEKKFMKKSRKVTKIHKKKRFGTVR